MVNYIVNSEAFCEYPHPPPHLKIRAVNSDTRGKSTYFFGAMTLETKNTLALLTLPITALVGAIVGGAYSYLAFVLFFIAIPILDQWVGIDKSPKVGLVFPSQALWFRLVVIFANLILNFIMAKAFLNTTLVGSIGVILSSSVTTAFIFRGIAHQIAHHKDKHSQLTSMTILAPILYAYSIPQHIHNHHHYATTKRDTETATYKQSFYSYFVNSIKSSWWQIYTYEAYRLRKKGIGQPINPKNKVYQGLMISAFYVSLLIFTLGPASLIFLVAHTALSVILIETQNYVGHYGLSRKELESGRFEPFKDTHGWNSEYFLSNFLLSGRGHTSAHHMEVEDPLTAPTTTKNKPTLPYGYITMSWIALITPLWHKLMDPLVQRVQRKMPLDLKKERRKKHRS